MDKKHENGMMVLATLVWLMAALIAIMCCSCSSKKVVTETLYVHDTLHISHTDTVSIERWSWKQDTVRVETERIVTLLQPDKSLPAETIRVETNNWHYQHEVVKDSASKVISRVDSILRALDRQKLKQVKSKPLFYPIDGFLIFLVVCGVICACLLCSKKIRP